MLVAGANRINYWTAESGCYTALSLQDSVSSVFFIVTELCHLLCHTPVLTFRPTAVSYLHPLTGPSLSGVNFWAGTWTLERRNNLLLDSSASGFDDILLGLHVTHSDCLTSCHSFEQLLNPQRRSHDSPSKNLNILCKRQRIRQVCATKQPVYASPLSYGSRFMKALPKHFGAQILYQIFTLSTDTESSGQQ